MLYDGFAVVDEFGVRVLGGAPVAAADDVPYTQILQIHALPMQALSPNPNI